MLFSHMLQGHTLLMRCSFITNLMLLHQSLISKLQIIVANSKPSLRLQLLRFICTMLLEGEVTAMTNLRVTLQQRPTHLWSVVAITFSTSKFEWLTSKKTQFEVLQ